MIALIIDDESRARNLLRLLLQNHCPPVGQIYEASNLLEGVACIQTVRPQLVFLDIEMPQHSGLELPDFLEPAAMNFSLVFTTAYDQYALQAFELNAIDYLLKPLYPKQVQQVVDRVQNQWHQHQLFEQLSSLKKSIVQRRPSKVAFPLSDGLIFVPMEELITLVAERMYTHVYTQNDDDFLVSKPLKVFTDALEAEPDFYRTHRSYLVNLNQIKRYVNTDGGYLLMNDGYAVSISRDRKKELLERLQQIG